MEEEKTNKFSYYRNIYEMIRYLPNKNRLELSDAINDYMFENAEPVFEGLSSGMWINIKRILDGYKTRVKNGKKGGAPTGNSNAKKQSKNNQDNNSKTTQKQPKEQLENNKNNILYYYNFIFSIFKFNSNINNLLKEYLELRIKKKYTLSETIVKRLCNKLNEYGKTDEEKEIIILNAINGGWKDFYPLKDEKPNNGYKTLHERNREVLDREREKLRKEKENDKRTSLGLT